MENALATLSIIAVALIFVAVVLYQRIYKITRNSIYVENGKKQIDDLYKKFSQLNIDLMKLEHNVKEQFENYNERFIRMSDDIKNHGKFLANVEKEQISCINKLEADCNERLIEQQNSIGFLEHNYDIIARSYNDLSARFEKIEAYIFTNPKPEDFGIEAESVTTKNKE